MADLTLVTYCGLYCSLCAERGRIPRQARTLYDTMVKEGYETWGSEVPGFEEFWRFLANLCDPDSTCPGCRQGGGPPFCGIRKCARRRGVEVCAFCDETPCERILSLAEGYPTLVSDGERMREIGLEAWIQEQEARAETGFAYADIRCHPYEVPSE
jgi:hypothetical protein